MITVQVFSQETGSIACIVKPYRQCGTVIKGSCPALGCTIRLDAMFMNILTSQYAGPTGTSQRSRYVSVGEIDSLLHQFTLHIGHVLKGMIRLVIGEDDDYIGFIRTRTRF